MLNKTYNKELKMGDVPEELLVEDTQDYVMARLKEKIQYYLKYQYKPIDTSKRCSPKVFDDIAKHNLVQKSLKRKNKRWNKKKKHAKDDTRSLWKLKHKRRCGCDYCIAGRAHKHLRAQKVFTKEEWFDDNWLYYLDKQALYEAYGDVFGGYIPNAPVYRIEQFLNEIGEDHLGLNFDWETVYKANHKVLGCNTDCWKALKDLL